MGQSEFVIEGLGWGWLDGIRRHFGWPSSDADVWWSLAIPSRPAENTDGVFVPVRSRIVDIRPNKRMHRSGRSGRFQVDAFLAATR